MSLPDWQRNGWLTAHKSSVREVRDLFGVVDRDLQDSAINEISTDARLGMAYNAALKAGTIALAAAGYRASRDQPHYRVIQSLAPDNWCHCNRGRTPRRVPEEEEYL